MVVAKFGLILLLLILSSISTVNGEDMSSGATKAWPNLSHCIKFQDLPKKKYSKNLEEKIKNKSRFLLESNNSNSGLEVLVYIDPKYVETFNSFKDAIKQIERNFSANGLPVAFEVD